MKSFTPPAITLRRYADVLVTFALNHGKGIKKGDVVMIVISESARPLLRALQESITKAGGHYLVWYQPEGEDRDINARSFYEHASKAQLSFTPHKYYKGMVDEADHLIYITSHTDPEILKGIDPQKIVTQANARLAIREYYRAKEMKGNFSWTIGLYGNEFGARAAGMSQKAYWDQILKGCYLTSTDPIAKWKETFKTTQAYKNKLDRLKIERVHVEGKDADLWLTLGKKRAWKTGSGNNIPSFEVFTSPDWRGTNGWIRFSQPLNKFGFLVEGIELEFKAGKVVKAQAKKNAHIIKNMLKTKNADKVGEFSLTDSRHSQIEKFMATTLFDENVGGRYGNTHIALGSAYRDCYEGDYTKVTDAGWEKLGYNNSVEHTDIISTIDRTVTAYLPGGKEKVIYKDGKFTL